MLGKRTRFFLNYFVGPVLFAVMAFSIYRQIQQQEDWSKKWELIKISLYGSQAWRLYLVLALMFVNWGIEARKWQLLLQHMKKISFIKSYQSVLSGVAFTMITPNRMGEFVGRVFYVEEGQRIRAAALTIVGSTSQLIITLLAGVIGIIVLRDDIALFPEVHQLSSFWIIGLFTGIIGVLIVIVVFYFEISWLVRLVEKIPALRKITYFIELLDNFKTKELLHILLLSAIRFVIFVSQYMLLFVLFDVHMPLWEGCCAVSVMFLMLAIIPMPGIAELGIRGKASIALFMFFSNNSVGILATTISIWLINIILPAVLGSLLVLNIKLFNKNEKTE